MSNSSQTTARSPFPPKPVLWFLFLFNLAVAAAVAAGVGPDGPQQLLTSAGMGAFALGAGAGVVRRRSVRV